MHSKLFVERTIRRLANFDKLLDEKITKYELYLSLDIKPRILFMLPEVKNFEEYLKRKIKDKEKETRLKKAKMLIKIIAALVMCFSFLLISSTMKCLLDLSRKMYELKKVKITKAKRRKNKKKQRKTILNV